MNPFVLVVLIIGVIMAGKTPKDVPPKMDPNWPSRVNPAYVQWKAEQQAKKQSLEGQRKHLADRSEPRKG